MTRVKTENLQRHKDNLIWLTEQSKSFKKCIGSKIDEYDFSLKLLGFNGVCRC